MLNFQKVIHTFDFDNYLVYLVFHSMYFLPFELFNSGGCIYPFFECVKTNVAALMHSLEIKLLFFYHFAELTNDFRVDMKKKPSLDDSAEPLLNLYD